VTELLVNDARHLHDTYAARFVGADKPHSEVAAGKVGKWGGAGKGGANGGGGSGSGGGGGSGGAGAGAASRWWLDDLGRSVAAVISIQPGTVHLLRALGRFLQSIEPLGFLPVTLTAIVLCGLTPAHGRPADLMHLLDIFMVGRCSLTVSTPVLKSPMRLALETII
jgi:hypothetical protein